jgi:hypothetical protein
VITVNDVLLTGVIWGAGLWIIWFGYFITQCPKALKNWVYRKRWRIFMLDLVIVFLGNNIINKASGTVTAGVGTFVLMFLAFGASCVMMFYFWAKQRVSEFW